MHSFSRSATCVSHSPSKVRCPPIDGTVTGIAVCASVLYISILIPVCFPSNPRALYETCYLLEVPVDFLIIIVEANDEYLTASQRDVLKISKFYVNESLTLS